MAVIRRQLPGLLRLVARASHVSSSGALGPCTPLRGLAAPPTRSMAEQVPQFPLQLNPAAFAFTIFLHARPYESFQTPWHLTVGIVQFFWHAILSSPTSSKTTLSDHAEAFSARILFAYKSDTREKRIHT